MQKENKSKTIRIDWVPDRDSDVPLYLQIVNYFGEQIQRGNWTGGQRIPSQRRLAEEFRVNRSTIVEAMSLLSSTGLVRCDHGGGTRISSNSWNSLLASGGPDWMEYIRSGIMHSNSEYIQMINRLEFEPDFLRLGTGELSPRVLPEEYLNRALMKLSRHGMFPSYAHPLGLPELRQEISRRLSRLHIEAGPENILITNGALQALQLIASGLTFKGTVLYTESPSYINSLNMYRSAGVQIKELPMDSEGILPWMIKKNENGILFTIPTFQNPSGGVMSEKRRKEILEVSRNYRLPIIEDDIFRELWLENEPPRPVKSYDREGNVIYIGSISKCISPGLRVGWVVAPQSVIERLADIKMQTDYGVSTISQQLATELFESGLFDKGMAEVRKNLRKSRDHLLGLLEQYFQGLAEWNRPSGGMFIWVRLKGKISSGRLFGEALKEKLLLLPGIVYGNRYDSYLRLNYGYLSEEEETDAIRRLSLLVRKMTGLS